MIPTIAADFSSMHSSAKETTEEVFKVLDSKIRQVQSLYSHVSSQVSCSESSAMKQLADCSNAAGGGAARDVVLDWRTDPFVSLSDLTLNVYTSGAAMINNAGAVSQQQQKAPTVYYTHTLLMAYGGRKSNFIAKQIRNQRRSRPTTTATARQHASSSSNNHRGGKGSIDKLILTESIVGRAYDKIIHRQNSNTSYSSGSSFVENNNHNNNSNHNNNNHNNSNHNNHMVEYKVDIHLPPLAAHYLPLLLDYIYGSTPTYTTNNACALRYLAHRFDTRGLYTNITNTFISCDLTLVTTSKYISIADELNDYEMRDCAILYLAQRLHKLSNNNDNTYDGSSNDDGNDDGSSHNEKGVKILACLEPRLLRRVLQCDKLVGGSSEEISILVAKYLQMYTNLYTTTTTNNNNNKDESNAISSNNVTSPSYSNIQSEAASVLTDEDFYWLTHCQIMPRISSTEAIYYFAYAAMNFPRIMAEVGSGSLKSRCLLACSSSCSAIEDSMKDGTKKDGSSSNVVLDSLTSYIEQRGITTDDNPSSSTPSSSLMSESYINLDYRYKVQLLECTLVDAKKQLNTKSKHYNRHTAMYEEVQQTEDIMYKKNNLKAVSSALTSPSMSSTNTGVIDNYIDTAAIVSKAVVLGCGILPANGLYLSSTTRNNNKGDCNSVTIYYEREGIWNGQHVIFLLYPVTLGQYYLQYKLGVRNCTPPPTAATATTTTEKKMMEDNNDGMAMRKKKIRILYNSPKIVIGDHAGHQYYHHNRGGHQQQQQQVIIPEGAWEVEQQVNGSGVGVPLLDEICPAPQFVGRVENSSL